MARHGVWDGTVFTLGSGIEKFAIPGFRFGIMLRLQFGRIG